MKQILTLFSFIFLFITAYAAPPTVPSSNLSFNGLDGGQFTGNFTNGNGTYRIIVMKEGSPVTGLPLNGVEYSYSTVFGTASSLFTASGEYVVAKTSWNNFTVSNLKPGTVYYVAIFEYHGTGTSTQYLMLPLTGSQSTVIAPTTQVSALTSTASTGNTISLSWTKGNGSGRIVIARKGAPVNVAPADLFMYWGDEIFGNGTKIGTDNYVVYKGNDASEVIRNLEPNTTYHFAAFEYNGNNSPMHLLPGVTFSVTTRPGPTVAPTAPGFNFIEGNSYTIGVTVGNGTRRLFVARKGAPVGSVPVNGTIYNANAAFGTAGTQIAPGEFVVAATTGSSVNVTNLEPNTIYHFRVFEYDTDNANTPYYLTTSYAVKSGSTATTPTTAPFNVGLLTLTGSSATINFTPGTGTWRTVIMKAGGPVDAAPVNLTRYSPNSVFGNGQQITPGNYVIHWGMNGAQFSVSNLVPGTTYYASIYEYNGTQAPVYSTSGAVFGFTVPLEPSSVSTNPWTALVEGASFRLIWTNGSGGRRMIVAKKGSAVTAKPVDKTNYSANASFGLGEEIAPGEFVVFDGTASEVNLKNMDVASTYHFAVYEYNVGPDGKPDYLTSSWLATSASTAAWPTTQTVITGVSGLQSSQAAINFTKGNGASRIFIMKQGAATNVEPQDLVKYTYNTAFGTASTLMSDGNYVIAVVSSTGSLTVTNLQPNTTYHVSAYEFNGSNEPAYLRTAPARYSFTTPDAPSAVTPTVPASNAVADKIDGNAFTFKWTNGNGEKRIVVMKKSGSVSFVPSNATTYTANASFGSGQDIGNGQYVVYSGNGNSVDITNLEPSTSYQFAVYEFTGNGSLLRYLTSQSLVATAGTASAPATSATGIVSSTTPGKITIGWTSGNGTGRIVVMKEGSAVTALPANLSVYPSNTVFKSGSQISAGEYVVYAGAGNSVTVTDLENKVYHFRIFEYNGTNAPVYNVTDVAAGSAVVGFGLPVKLLYFTAREVNDKVELNWATSQEINNKSFVVERSADGNRFESIQTIAGVGNSNTTTRYSYVDATVSAAKVYYRLKQVDEDGNFTYSPVVSVSLKTAEGKLNIYPNPVSDRFKISLPSQVNKGTLMVYDSRGVLVHKLEITDGQYVNASGWTSGIYHLSIIANGKQYQGRMIKR